MKYLLIQSYGGIAIPLESLAACGKIEFVNSEWNDEKKIVEYFHVHKESEGKVIDSSDILPAKEPT